jgi:hypothetical protein
MWKWLSANREADNAKERIWKAWAKHRAREDWRERMEDRRVYWREARQPAEGEGEEENDSRRAEAWQGRQESVRTRGELRGDRKGGTGESGPEGWTMAATLIVYMKGEQRKADGEGVSRDTVILRLGPRASRGIRPPPVYIALRFKPATLTALWGRGVRESLPGGAQPFQVEPGSRPAASGISGGARSDDPNRMSRPTPERALPSQVGGAA